ncbi:MAG: tetratricopeptide repeat protein [Bacteroidales bacterium]|nr:tetratricopeptide repeat protein [Bacteroidales bacterium]
MAQKENRNEDARMQSVESAVSRTEGWFESHQKLVTIVFAVIIVVALGIISYAKFVKAPKEKDAMVAMYNAEFAFEEEDFELALNGNEEGVTGFAEIVDEYGSTPSGNVARYCAGVCCMRLGQYEEAISYLKDFSSDDPMMEPQALGLMAGAYSELGDNEKAAEYYVKAAEKANNEILTPKYLIDAGNVYEILGNYQKALETYKKVQDEYYTKLNSQDKSNIEKYIQRAELKVK